MHQIPFLFVGSIRQMYLSDNDTLQYNDFVAICKRIFKTVLQVILSFQLHGIVDRIFQFDCFLFCALIIPDVLQNYFLLKPPIYPLYKKSP